MNSYQLAGHFDRSRVEQKEEVIPLVIIVEKIREASRSYSLGIRITEAPLVVDTNNYYLGPASMIDEIIRYRLLFPSSRCVHGEIGETYAKLFIKYHRIEQLRGGCSNY